MVNHVVHLFATLTVGVVFQEILQSGDGRVSRRLVKSRVRRLEERCTSIVVACQLRIFAFGIGLEIAFEIEGCRLIVVEVEVAHAHHEERLFSAVGTLQHTYQFVEQLIALHITASRITLLGCLVLIVGILRLKQVVVTVAARGEHNSRQEQGYDCLSHAYSWV